MMQYISFSYQHWPNSSDISQQKGSCQHLSPPEDRVAAIPFTVVEKHQTDDEMVTIRLKRSDLLFMLVADVKPEKNSQSPFLKERAFYLNPLNNP